MTRSINRHALLQLLYRLLPLGEGDTPSQYHWPGTRSAV